MIARVLYTTVYIQYSTVCRMGGGGVEQNIDKNSVFPIITAKTGNTQCMHRCTPFGVYLQWTKEIHITFYSHMFFYDLIWILYDCNVYSRIYIMFYLFIIFSNNRIPGPDFLQSFLLYIVHKCRKRMERGAMICGNSGKSIAILYVVILTMQSNYDTARYRRLLQQPV